MSTRGKIFSFATMMMSAQRRHAAKVAAQAPAQAVKPQSSPKKPAQKVRRPLVGSVSRGDDNGPRGRSAAWLQMA